MIKFVLTFIAIILVTLGIYTYSNQESEKTVPTSSSVTKVTEKVEVEEEKVLPQVQEVKTKKSSAKNITVKSPKVVSSETSNEAVDTEKIGKGLTLESIENADVSDEEKERMIDDLAYYQTNNIDIEAEESKRKSIGSELTLQGIMAADVSNAEKERMLDDLAYYQTNNIDANGEYSLTRENIK